MPAHDARPDFVFILADDLGYADLGCYGAREPVSPQLDAMAAAGLRFTHGYSNSPVCSPTRFALATGQYQYRLRGAAEEPIAGSAKGSDKIGLPPGYPTIASLLRGAGYATALVGKWHLGYPPHFGPLKSGYDVFFGPVAGGVDYHSHLDRSGAHDLWEGEAPVHCEGYLTDLISERAARFVETLPAGRPYCLNVNYTAPHWPWEAREDAAESRRIGREIQHTDGGSLPTYQRMIRQMDEGIGRILAAIAARGNERDTLVVFTSDNGGERFSDNWPFVGQKMDLLEGGIRVPLVARWPARIEPGRSSDVPVITMDWPATMLEAARVAADPAHPMDGTSLLPLFADRDWRPQRDLCWRTLHRDQRALRSGKWKYLRVDGHEYLFDVVHDPRERANFARREPARLAELRERWERWAGTMPRIPPEARVSLVFGDADLPRATF